ncbi:MAG: hypothetical protein GX060_02300 [Firmicutes bacterium]|jgi:arsenate reductase-like glutaredoxin family protein|nr:hypothetical protein [Bacillota bacterium]
MAGLQVRELVNARSQVLRRLQVKAAELDNEQSLQMMQENPRIIIRPLLTDGQKVWLRFDEDVYSQVINAM